MVFLDVTSSTMKSLMKAPFPSKNVPENDALDVKSSTPYFSGFKPGTG